ncbi:AI-2E family transporter [Olsenella urininfantis]|uniref:AI-2E family transporter n=1 Tax=Olsenella urininfantis TaxID=1871033 RepID=UPI0009871058|nr:AI-2E family transporter [Olsenella urininfantis]
MIDHGESGQEASGTVRARRVGAHAWALVGCMLAAVLVVRALGLVWPAVELLLVGVVLGFICSPVTNALERRGVPRALAALLALLLLVSVVVLAGVVLGPAFLNQLVDMLQRMPRYVSQLRAAASQFWDAFGSSRTQEVQTVLDQLLAALSNMGLNASTELIEKLSSGFVSNVVSLVNNLFTLFLGLVLAYWLAKDYPRIVRELGVVAGPAHEDELFVVLAVMSRSMGGYMRGIVITSAAGGLLSFAGFALIGHPYAGLMGIVVGVLHFVPVIGPWLAAGLAMLLALFASPALALETLVVSVIAQNVTDNLISPLVMRSAVKVHPALSLVGIIIGSALGGMLGMVLAIPLTAAIRSVFVYYFETKTGRQLVSYEGALFQSTPFHDDEGVPLPAFDALDDDKFFESTLLVSSKGARCPVADEPPRGRRGSLATRILNARDASTADAQEKEKGA